jgi:hypothetical protein
MKKKIAVGAALAAGVAFVLGPLRKRRQHDDREPTWYGPEETTGWAGTTATAAAAGAGAGAPVAVGADVVQRPDPEDVRPEDLTSPGTVDDPELEEQRAREAAERERESRASDETKFDELRQEAAATDAAEVVGDVPAPRDD